MLYLVHHADAVGPDVDPMRPLSARGRAGAALVALEAARRGAKPELIWHSGKLRARQTAEAFWKACNPFATLSAERGLLPGDPPSWMRDRVYGDTRDVMLVGHMPHMAGLLDLVTGGESDPFPLNGMVALESEGGQIWKEMWRLSP